MKLFAGLGNPGAKHALNRHNLGFMAVDRIHADHDFGPWRKAFLGLVAEGRLGGNKVLLLKPLTFMNLSGQSVRAVMDFYKLSPEDDITVLHDEMDLAPGKLRVKRGGGHAGHNGLRSIHAHVGAAYTRVRLGIGHPADRSQVIRYVLENFSRADEAWIEPLLAGVSEGADLLAAGDTQRFMNVVSRHIAPARHSGSRSGQGSTRAQLPKAAADAAGHEPTTPPAPKKQPAEPPKAEENEQPDPRGLIDRLRDHFRR